MLLSTFNKELYEKELKDDAYNKGQADGFLKGETNGAKKKLMELIQKKLAKGKSLETIADELEESVETIEKLISQISENTME